MLLNFSIVDVLSNPITPDTIVINGTSIAPAPSISYTIPDNSVVSLTIIANGYYTYSQTFQVFDIDLNVSITLIATDCKRIDPNDVYINECCNANFFVIDNPCNNSKQIVKASSTPSMLTLYNEDDKVIDFGNVITIPDYLICEPINKFIVVSKIDKDCGCDGTDFPPCYDEIELEIPKQECLCQGSFSFTHDFCYDKIYPFIDFETTKFFKQERWYLVIDIPITFIFNLPCIRTELEVYEQATNSYVTISYRKQVIVTITLYDEDNTEITTITETLPNDFTDTELSDFLSNLFIIYTFIEKGKYRIEVLVDTNCIDTKYEKELYVTDNINLFVNEDCRLYDVIACNDIFDIVVKRIQETIPITTITYNNGIITGNTTQVYLTDDMKLYLGLEDGVYEIIINNGLEEKKFIVVHFCNAKNCYINLSKRLYCNEMIANEREMYNVISFYMLYKLVIEYYTLLHPIMIVETTLSNSDNLKFIEIDKALEKLKQLCNPCGEGMNEVSEQDCGCNDTNGIFPNINDFSL